MDGGTVANGGAVVDGGTVANRSAEVGGGTVVEVLATQAVVVDVLFLCK